MDITFKRSAVPFISRLDLFATLTRAELHTIDQQIVSFSRTPGEFLFRKGDLADGMYLVERGEVSVLTTSSDGEPVTLAYLGNDSVIGEMGLIDGGNRSASVEAASMTNGYFLARERFERLRTERNVAAYKIILGLASTLEQRRRVTKTRVDRLVEDPDRAKQIETPAIRELIARVYKV